jgi:Uncharacterized conserved protein (DUF2358)
MFCHQLLVATVRRGGGETPSNDDSVTSHHKQAAKEKSSLTTSNNKHTLYGYIQNATNPNIKLLKKKFFVGRSIKQASVLDTRSQKNFIHPPPMMAAGNLFHTTGGFLVSSAGLICLVLFRRVDGLLAGHKRVALPRLLPRIADDAGFSTAMKNRQSFLFLQPTNSLETSSRGSILVDNNVSSLSKTSTGSNRQQQLQQQPLYSTTTLSSVAFHNSHHSSTAHHTSTTAAGLVDEQHTILVDAIRQHILQWQDDWYDRALHLRCPFFRRRATDAVEVLHEIVRVVLDPQEQWLGPNPSLVCRGKSCTKHFGATVDDVLAAIRSDWRGGGVVVVGDDNDNDEPTTSIDSSFAAKQVKGYYVTGKLSTDVYRDDCFFDGPDPDMPVKGLRKYMNAASQLFDQKQSWSKLLSLEKQDDDNVIVARWQFSGVLRLPWKPLLPLVQGSTTYHIDAASGLVDRHVETWDMSATEAFLRTFFPAIFPPR